MPEAITDGALPDIQEEKEETGMAGDESTPDSVDQSEANADGENQTEIDKYELETDPDKLRNGRARAKAAHTSVRTPTPVNGTRPNDALHPTV